MREAQIFYLASDNATPTGGEKSIYQHVDVLNAAGFDAYALHEKPGYRHAWFENRTRTITVRDFWRIYDIARDYLVISEPAGRLINSVPGRKVIFNKNLYIGFAAFGQEPPTPYPYSDPSVIATFAVSEHNCAHLRCAFPAARVYRMSHHIDVTRYTFRPLSAKRARIVCVAKEPAATAVLYHMLMARAAAGLNKLAAFTWTPLTGRTEAAAAAMLDESLIAISLSTHEGLPRTLLEAMACGCIVIAHGAGAGLEFLPPEYQYVHDDFVAMVRAIETVTDAYPSALQPWEAVTMRARRVAESFTRARQAEAVVAAWTEILSASSLEEEKQWTSSSVG
jgi:hypothetical protein